MDNVFTYHIEKLSIPHMYKNVLSIWHIDSFSTCGIYKEIMSILDIDKIIIFYIVYGQFVYISYRIFIAYIMYRKMYIYNIDKYTFVSTWYIQFVYLICRQKYLCIYCIDKNCLY